MKEYFMAAYRNKHGIRYKLTRNGRAMTATINLYIEGKLHSVQPSARAAQKIARSITREEKRRNGQPDIS